MRAGRMDRTITLLRPGAAVDDGYTEQPGWIVLARDVPAAVTHRPGSERLQSAETAATAPTVFLIRWTPALDPAAVGGLNPKDRVQYGGRTMDIQSAIELGRHDTIEIAAVAAVD